MLCPADIAGASRVNMEPSPTVQPGEWWLPGMSIYMIYVQFSTVRHIFQLSMFSRGVFANHNLVVAARKSLSGEFMAVVVEPGFAGTSCILLGKVVGCSLTLISTDGIEQKVADGGSSLSFSSKFKSCKSQMEVCADV